MVHRTRHNFPEPDVLVRPPDAQVRPNGDKLRIGLSRYNSAVRSVLGNAMETPAILLTLAEVSIAYVGFAAIFGILSTRAEAWPSDVQLMFRALVEVGLAALFISVIPSGLALLQFEHAHLWLIASAIALASAVTISGWRIYLIRSRLVRFPREAPLLLTMSTVNLALLTGNILIWRAAGPYVLALIVSLVGASSIFLAMIYRMFPILRERE